MANATPSTIYYSKRELRHVHLIITFSILQYHIHYLILKGVSMTVQILVINVTYVFKNLLIESYQLVIMIFKSDTHIIISIIPTTCVSKF
nr:MAG TPA: hypothetical protein [Caudoviricetes sp.]